MIEILPMEDREKEKALLEGLVTGSGAPRVLRMAERGEALGWVAVEVDGPLLRILKMEAAGYDPAQKPQGEQVFLLDTLLRSAASYGETLGAEEIATVFPDFFDFFKNRGFDCDNTHAFGPMGLIVKYG